MAMPDKGSDLVEVEGKWNKREQLVIKHMKIKNIDEYIKIVGTPE